MPQAKYFANFQALVSNRDRGMPLTQDITDVGPSTLKAPRTGSWDEVTLGALVAEIAAEHGYEARVDPSLAESPVAQVDQVAESDLHLLRRVVSHYDATLKAAAGHRVVVRRGSARTAGTGVPLPITAVVAAGYGRVDQHPRSREGAGTRPIRFRAGQLLQRVDGRGGIRASRQPRAHLVNEHWKMIDSGRKDDHNM